jgi:ankyrin repeat protein
MLEKLPVCKLSKENCFIRAVVEENWYFAKLHLDTAPQRVNTATKSGGVTALMKFGHVAEYAQYLLQLGANVNAQDTHGDSVLIHVVKHKYVEPEELTSM